MDYTQVQTPCYIINQADYEKNIRDLMEAFETGWQGKVLYGYSVKTNHCPHLFQTAMEFGWRGEVVSPDEYAFVKSCGCPEDRIIYNGPQKRDTVLAACRAGAMVNLDNLEEVALVARSLTGEEKKHSVIGIRVNYDLESECPGETTCRQVVGRFGISYENGDVEKAIRMLREAGIPLRGLHMHQSSSSRSLKIYESIAGKVLEIVDRYPLPDLEYVDMGGGFFGGNFFPGKPDIGQYARTICEILKTRLDSRKITLVLEPGAAVLATSMDYLVSVLNIRDIRGKTVVTVDGSVVHINPFMNPHPTPFTILNPGEEIGREKAGEQIIGGSTCMEMDRIYPRDIRHAVTMDTRLLFHCCGAYMSTHNSSFINAAPHIYVKEKDSFRMLRQKDPAQMLRY